MLKKNGILRKNREEGFEKSYVPLHGGRGVKNCQNHPYVINEWPLSIFNTRTMLLVRNLSIEQVLCF